MRLSKNEFIRFWEVKHDPTRNLQKHVQRSREARRRSLTVDSDRAATNPLAATGFRSPSRQVEQLVLSDTDRG